MHPPSPYPTQSPHFTCGIDFKPATIHRRGGGITRKQARRARESAPDGHISWEAAAPGPGGADGPVARAAHVVFPLLPHLLQGCAEPDVLLALAGSQLPLQVSDDGVLVVALLPLCGLRLQALDGYLANTAHTR